MTGNNKNTHANSLISIATIISKSGIKGYVKVLSHTEDPVSIFEYQNLSIDGIPIKISKINSYKTRGFVCKIDIASNIEEAEKLRGKEICIHKKDLPKLDEDEYYVKDILGYSVLDSDEKFLGKIVQICNYGAGDIIEYKDESGKREMIPLNSDFIRTLDIERKVVIIESYEIF